MDYLIIGAGPGGYELAAAAAAKGHSVTLIERDLPGGTCLNRGCIPTKAMANAADILRTALSGTAYGINCPEPTIDYAALCARRNEVVATLRQGVEILLSKVNVVKGEARFAGSHSVEVGEEIFTADRIVIATGSIPALPPIPGAETALTSDGLLSMTSLPESMIIVGGGVIGMEFASIFNTLGCRVAVVEYCKEILPPFDKDIAKRLRADLSAAGVEFLTSCAVKAIDGYRVVCEAKGEERMLEAEVVAIAAGRRPCLPDGLQLAGIELTDRGAIKVNPDTFETTAERVYAIGDVNGLCMLAHAASAQGRRVLGEEVNLDVIPSVVFTHPELAMVGPSETTLKERGVAFKTAKSLFRANGKALSMGETSGIVKLIYDPATQTLLGASVMGPHAADLISELALALANRLTLADIAMTIHPHPSLSEALLSAATTV